MLAPRSTAIAILCLAALPCQGQSPPPAAHVAASAASDRLELAVQIVGADVVAAPDGDEPALRLPPAVMERLRELLRYRSYRLLARTEIRVGPEGATSHEVGPGYRVAFELQETEDPDRLRMRGFRLSRRDEDGGAGALVETDLDLEVGRPLIVGLSRSETSREALMIVLQATRPDGERS